MNQPQPPRRTTVRVANRTVAVSPFAMARPLPGTSTFDERSNGGVRERAARRGICRALTATLHTSIVVLYPAIACIWVRACESVSCEHRQGQRSVSRHRMRTLHAGRALRIAGVCGPAHALMRSGISDQEETQPFLSLASRRNLLSISRHLDLWHAVGLFTL